MDAREAAAAQLEAIDSWFPGWHAWPRVGGGLYYARRARSSPPVVIRACRLTHLMIRVAVRDAQIRAWLAGQSRRLPQRARRGVRRAGRALEPCKGGSCARR